MKVVPESRPVQERLDMKRTTTTSSAAATPSGVASKKRMIRVVITLVALHHHLGVLTRRLGLLKGTRIEARNTHRESGIFKLMIPIKPWIILLVPSSNETKPLAL